MTPNGPEAATRITPSSDSAESQRLMANAVRALAMDAVEAAQSGHPGLPLGMADVATVLFTRFLKFDPAAPDWPDRDRFVLSAGHGSMLLYALLHLTGYADMTLDELRRFRQLGSRTAGHPEYGHAAGIETTTGPLGQGLANAVGMALAERRLNAEFGDDIVDHFTYAIAGDGCLMEGISQEAASLAGHLRLSRLIVLFDDNGISIDGPTGLTSSEDIRTRFAADGWETAAVDGHDAEAVATAIAKARTNDRPTLIACRTVIGYGTDAKAGTAAAHGAPLGADEIAAARQNLGWDHPPFVIPDAVLSLWRGHGTRGARDRDAWSRRHGEMEDAARREFDRRQSGALPEGAEAAFDGIIGEFLATSAKLATRKASQAVIGTLAKAVPEMVGGSADLTDSNGTRGAGMTAIAPGDFGGNYIHYGIREHAMAAAMNGIALHGGLIPFGGTFMVFTDYLRPALRLSALMGQRVVYVMTHDSIGLGEDGPTHQPVEHLASLRAIPGLRVFRPADAVETAECWALALAGGGPSVIALTRQSVAPVRHNAETGNLSARGAYIAAPPANNSPTNSNGNRRATLLATGSEVGIALAARDILEAEGIAAAVVSMPCWELFDAAPDDYRATVLAPGTVRVAVEAAIGFGWERYVGDDGAVICLEGFGASAPAPALYDHFGITAAAMVAAVKARL